MKKTLLLLSTLSLIACGCNTTSFEATKLDGTYVRIANSRLLWTTDGYAATLTTNGASLSASKSSTDGATIQAIAQGVAAGVIQGAKTP